MAADQNRIAGMAAIFLVIVLAASTTLAASLELTWDRNTEADLAGYRIYRSYSTAGLSPVADTKNNSYVFPNVSTGRRYYYAVTAYNTTDMESYFSNLVRVYILRTPVIRYTIRIGSKTFTYTP